ncbi:hypothetical protein BpHYR1_005661 [Brachionus plicatilis]|uniref:Uncharacterized protein n=1 Tax=Brachionus plicatilis TaxID=10195 RepID=A0A3M7Q0E8_BRAPC|nr:hypothetical protein BpHYR1_005661 [Brachionus plicatilis]
MITFRLETRIWTLVRLKAFPVPYYYEIGIQHFCGLSLITKSRLVLFKFFPTVMVNTRMKNLLAIFFGLPAVNTELLYCKA